MNGHLMDKCLKVEVQVKGIKVVESVRVPCPVSKSSCRRVFLCLACTFNGCKICSFRD